MATSSMPPPATVPARVPPATVRYDFESILLDALAGVDIEEVADHRQDETAWNSEVNSLICTSLSKTRSNDPYRIRSRAGANLWSARLAPHETPYRDTPCQRKIVEVVLRNRLKLASAQDVSPDIYASKRGLIGLYIPDICSMLYTYESPQHVDPLKWTMVSLVAELKVTHIGRRNGKPIILSGAFDDPDLVHDELLDDIASHYSLRSSEGGHDEAIVVQVDGVAKWRAGLAKALLYLTSSSEYCGAYLGVVLIGTRFARLVLEQDGDKRVIFVESKGMISDMAVSVAAFLGNDSRAHDLPWDLTQRADSTTSVQWDLAALRTLLDFSALSFRILAAHTTPVPFTRLDLPSTHSETLKVSMHSLRSPVQLSNGVDDVTYAVTESRSLPRTYRAKVQGEISAPLEPDDGDEGGGDGGDGPGHGHGGQSPDGDAGARDGPPTSKRRKPNDHEAPRRSPRNHTRHGGVQQWLAGVELPVSLDTGSADSSIEISTPIDDELSLPVPVEDDQRRDTPSIPDKSTDVCPTVSLREECFHLKQHEDVDTAEEVDYAGFDQQPSRIEPTADEIMEVLGTLGVMVLPVGTATMSAIVAEMSVSLA